MATEQELKTLIQKRGQLKASITRFSNFVDKFSENQDFVQLQLRLNTILDIMPEFVSIQSQIECIADKPDNQERTDFEDNFFRVVSRAQIIINAHTNSNLAQSGTSNNSLDSQPRIKNPNVKLPVLDLPHFHGDYTQWIQFKDNFISLVHSDNTLSNITKFRYLNSCLKGDAENALSSIEITEENYETAWKFLHERFEDKKIIKHNHLKKLIDWPKITNHSDVELRKLLEGLQLHLHALNSLGEKTGFWDSIIIYIFSQKLDSASNKHWKEFSQDIADPNLDDFKKFLMKQYKFLESLQENKIITDNKINKKMEPKNRDNRSLSFATSTSMQCFLCKNSHYIYKCPTLLKLPVKLRLVEIKKLKLCINCLRNTHTSETCTSGGCKHCGRKHNSILHFGETIIKQEGQSQNDGQVSSNISSQQNVQNIPSGLNDNSSETLVSTHSSHFVSKGHSEVLLSTAVVQIKDKRGNFHQCRALLDSGSQSNFMRRDLCDALQLKKYSINIPVAGINKKITNISYRTNATIQSRFNDFNITLSFLVLDKITENLPVSKINTKEIQIPNNIILADPNYNIPGKIDLLIGASVFFELLSIGQIKLNVQQPVLQKTKLGWVISGNVSSEVSSISNTSNMTANNSCTVVCNFTTNLEQQLEKFWCVEDIEQQSSNSKYSKEEQECEQHFSTTTRRNEDGHFIVELPFRDNIEKLGDNYNTALKRFQLLENRFERNKDLKQQYMDFIQEYQELGHMSLAPPPESDKNLYYLPHHGVYKNSSTTTKLRVVFDGSSQSESGLSLNDTLKVGPTVQEDLFSILLRFRKHNFVLVADIEKMYRQVFVSEEQRDFQRIIWRSDPSHRIQHYRLNTVTYGTASASFLATRSLHQISIDTKHSHPEVSRTVLKDFYVDDVLTGTHSIQEARQLVQGLIQVLHSYGFPLRKWLSNDKAILQGISETKTTSHFICDDSVTKTLGLIWNSETDSFHYSVNVDNKQTRATKRTILSVISQIFDPLGLIGPIVIRAKCIIQKLWQLKLGWDEAIPINLHTIWFQLYNQMHHLNNINIPRHIICHNPKVIQLHSFSDASEQAYGACIYIRSTDSSNNHLIRLVAAKSRVAPLKNITLPRLELCAALLSAQLTQKVIQAIDLKIDEIHYWCDSTIAISWINGESNTWKTFVANRVAEIQRLSDKQQWRHVDSNENPADIISRGITPDKLANLTLWWQGPHWLSQENLILRNNFSLLNDIPEKRKNTTTLTNYHPNQDIFYKYSSLTKLQRVVAWCLRFKNNSFQLNDKKTGPLSLSELNTSLVTLIKLSQLHSFSNEIDSLSKSKLISRKSKLISLNPFLDKNGIIRVGGRLKNPNLSHNIKYPIVLPNHHPFTKLIIVHEHHRHLHAGIQATLCVVRTNYWPLNGRSLVRGTIRRCIKCFKVNPPITPHQMGQLPISRTEACRPFLTVGIDFAGPFNIKDGKCRNRKIIKCYLCVFICFVTKAIHLELVGDLTSESFLNALRRLVSRRGLCKTIYSDNATNFVGANKELKRMLSNLHKHSKFHDFLSQNSISWKFIPPRSPHFGGIWEAAVKSAKYHLKRILSNAHLTFEEFYTVLTQIEAVLNSRPLTPLSSDPNDFLSLTPGHFLIGEPLTSIPQEDVMNVPSNRLSKYKRLQQLVQHFWSRWSREYLTSLHQRTKWKFQQPNGVAVGSMVLLRDDNTPPLHWKLGRISEVFPGDDGIIRVVCVKTAGGIVKRGVSKVSVLPIESS